MSADTNTSQWKCNDNNAYFTFTPVEPNILIAALQTAALQTAALQTAALQRTALQTTALWW